MTAVLIALTLIFHVGLPLAFLAWLWFRRPKTRVDAIALVFTGGSFLAWLTVGGFGWDWVGVYLPWLFWAGVIAASIRALRRSGATPWAQRGVRPILRIVGFLGLTIVFTHGLIGMFQAWRCPPGAVALAFPLRSGTYVVTRGGSGRALNQHAAVKAQSFALDIVKINALGVRASGFLPADLPSYVIYGDPVFSPCAGEVIASVDKYDNQTPPSGDGEHVAGNHVVVYCDGVSVLLAHLKPGSVQVAQGARVSVGDRVAAVGNTGNTSEPHLHIHAVRGRETDFERIAWTGDPIPITFDGRFFVRNSRVTL
jgi:hypothetical protein